MGAMFSPYAFFALATEDAASIPGLEVETGRVTIAGRSGICYTFRPQAMLGSNAEYVRQCLDDQLGFTLLLEVKEAGAAAVERLMELVAFGPPQPGDFEPSGPVIPLPTG